MKKRRQLIDPDTLVLLKQIGIGLLVISSAVLLIIAIWYGTRLSSLTVDEIEVRGGETIVHSEVEVLIWQALEGNYIGLVPRKFIWFLPEKDVVQEVETFERLYNVSVRKDGGTKIIVSFDEYVPKSLWCDSVEGEECLFLDSNGYAFGRSPNLAGGSFLRFITSGREITIGESITDEASFESLLSLSSLLAEQKWFVSHVELDQVGDVYLGITGGGELKVTASESPENTVRNLLTVLSSEDFAHLKPGNFQYIDLRFGNKVFVNEEEEVLLEEGEEFVSTESDEVLLTQ